MLTDGQLYQYAHTLLSKGVLESELQDRLNNFLGTIMQSPIEGWYVSEEQAARLIEWVFAQGPVFVQKVRSQGELV